MKPGGTIRFEVVDADSGDPLEHASVWMESHPKTLPPHFICIPLREGNASTFVHLRAGNYQFSISRGALLPNDLEYDLRKELETVEVADGETKRLQVALKGRRLNDAEIKRRWPYVAKGTVIDASGKPIQGARVHAVLHPGDESEMGSTTTDSQGRYTLRFRGIYEHPEKQRKPPFVIEELQIVATKRGFVERNMNQHGSLNCALRLPGPDEESEIEPQRLILPDKPTSLDFVLVPQVNIAVQILDSQQLPEGDASVWLHGDLLPKGDHRWLKRTNLRGRLTLVGLVPGQTWWFSVHKESGVERTPPLKFASAGKYAILLAPRIDQETGLDRLEVVRVEDASGKSVTHQVVDYTTAARNRSGEEIQAQGVKILRKLRELNRYWLGLPPPEVKNFVYLTSDSKGNRELGKVRKLTHSSLFDRRGIRYMSAIDQIVRDLDNVVVERVTRQDDVITIDYHLHLPAHVQIALGKRSSSTGLGVSGGTLVIDAERYTLHESRSKLVTEKLSQYVEIRPGHFVPLKIVVDRYDLRFRVHHPGLWVFERAYRDGNTNEAVAHASTLSINIPYPDEDKSADDEAADNEAADNETNAD